MRRTTIFATALLLLAATVGLTSSGTLLALSQHQVPGRVQRTLTLQQRVSYQRAIEEVYWRHRIWPKENSNPKPSLDAVGMVLAAGAENPPTMHTSAELYHAPRVRLQRRTVTPTPTASNTRTPTLASGDVNRHQGRPTPHPRSTLG